MARPSANAFDVVSMPTISMLICRGSLSVTGAIRRTAVSVLSARHGYCACGGGCPALALGVTLGW